MAFIEDRRPRKNTERERWADSGVYKAYDSDWTKRSTDEHGKEKMVSSLD
jgi:hypothetical protein